MWSHRLHKGGNFHVLVPPGEGRRDWESRFGCGVYMDDVQSVIDQQSMHSDVETLIGEGQGLGEDWFSKYQRYDEIVKRTKELAEAHPTLARFVPSIGKTHEKRDIVAIHITASTPKTGRSLLSTGQSEKPKIWLNGGQHAREWIAPATTMYAAQRLLTDYKKGDKQVKQMMDKFEFVVAPVVNPDGYEFTFTGNRLWRKNRRDNKDGTMGVDLNRNWQNHWGEGGASTNPGSIDYQGPSAASEPEVQGVQKYISGLKNKVSGIDFHSYGELMLRSKGWTKQTSKDENMLVKAADNMVNAVKKVRGTSYKSEMAAGLYPTTGSMDDWMSENAKNPPTEEELGEGHGEGHTKDGIWGHGWTIELAGSEHGNHGFLLPPSEIIPVSKEMFEGIKSFTSTMLNEETKRREMGAAAWRKQWMMKTARSDAAKKAAMKQQWALANAEASQEEHDEFSDLGGGVSHEALGSLAQEVAMLE